MAEIRVKKYETELQSQLFPENSFYKNSRTETGIGINVETIEIPQASVAGAVAVGVPGSLPLTISQRVDDIKTYPVQQLYMEEPTLITDENEIVISYNKRNDIQQSHALAINTMAGDIAAQAWGANLAIHQVRTTGTTRATDIVGATGTRKGIAYADLVDMHGIINRMNAPPGSWYGLLDPSFVSDIFNISTLTDADKTQLALIQSGKIGTIFGVKFMMRYNSILGTNGISYDNAGTPQKKAVGAAGAATDNAAALVWHNRMVRHAEGHNKLYIDRDNPAYLGTILNSKVRFGATFDRADEVGILAIVETLVT